MKTILDSEELLILVIIAAVFATVLGFMVANFGNHTKEEKITTFRNTNSTFETTVAKTSDPAEITELPSCGIIRTL